MTLLLDEEATLLCGARRHMRSPNRCNRRAGYYDRSLLTRFGKARVRVPHLMYIHPRISMLKRYRRVEEIVMDALSDSRRNGASDETSRLLVKTLWTVDLSGEFLDELARKVSALLDGCLRAPDDLTEHAGVPIH